MDLPTEGEKLQHYTRQRPRPNRVCRKPPRKSHGLSSYSESADKIQTEVCPKVDEGIDEFFSKKIIQEYHQSPLHVSSGTVTLSPSGSRTFKKKIGEFFALRKPRSAKSAKFEKEQNLVVAKGRKQSSANVLRPLCKSGETAEWQDADKDVTSPEIRSVVDSTWTPDAARRIKPRYSREGKSQSLIILSRDDEESFANKQKKHYGKNDDDVCNTFEHRVHSMLHRIGVTRILSSEMKKKQSKDGEIKKAGSEGDIVDNSADSPPPSLKVRTHSLSTERISPNIADPLHNPTEGMQVWKSLRKQLNTELKGRHMELHSSPRRSLAIIDHVETTLQKKTGGSLPAFEQCSPVPSLSRSTHLGITSEANNSTIKVFGEEENVIKPQLRLKQFQSRRAVSAHEDQLREQGYTSELANVEIPVAQLQRSPVIKLKQLSENFTETKCMKDTRDSKKCDQQRKPPDSPLPMKSEGTTTSIALETAQNTAIDQRIEITSNHSPTDSN
ncbi:capping protein, Arp2/3 and myosin-I linker protein 2 isoform X2 [Spea bombifrons]|uniref:capping protein, Arp2/3 and myosin-I linker protein 2 isoform X2 n=1 Tax=Spea bombifrons TaxID=233779 RepID=UPI002349A4FB|nr:capping protein, Arp2/3 and myosin-I linker protein 2 isoform X2 [Spea bombifrons]